jgi:hypothetical protein
MQVLKRLHRSTRTRSAIPSKDVVQRITTSSITNRAWLLCRAKLKRWPTSSRQSDERWIRRTLRLVSTSFAPRSRSVQRMGAQRSSASNGHAASSRWAPKHPVHHVRATRNARATDAIMPCAVIGAIRRHPTPATITARVTTRQAMASHALAALHTYRVVGTAYGAQIYSGSFGTT